MSKFICKFMSLPYTFKIKLGTVESNSLSRCKNCLYEYLYIPNQGVKISSINSKIRKTYFTEQKLITPNGQSSV